MKPCEFDVHSSFASFLVLLHVGSDARAMSVTASSTCFTERTTLKASSADTCFFLSICSSCSQMVISFSWFLVEMLIVMRSAKFKPQRKRGVYIGSILFINSTFSFATNRVLPSFHAISSVSSNSRYRILSIFCFMVKS